MSFYPSLEDLGADEMGRAQVAQLQSAAAIQNGSASAAYNAGQAAAATGGDFYAGLGLEEFTNYGGLDITPAAMSVAVPSFSQANYQPVARITQANDLGMVRAEVKQGVRPVTLAKNQEGKLGLAVTAIDKGLFVAFVWRDSAAALGGLRFGDQILQINGQNVAGWSMKQALKFLKEADAQSVKFAIRDRPFARAVTVQKDTHNHVGFMFKHAEITAIVKDSSAARNGVLINHTLMEVNGQNVVGIKDKDLQRILQESPSTVTLTITPTHIYKHLVSKIGFSKIKAFMDHGIPEL